ncbi:MAG: tetratricopeptide repeat protein [Ignavibacteria bacterium]
MPSATLIPGRLAGGFWVLGGRWLARKGLTSLAETCYRHGAAAAGGRASAEAGFLLSQQLLARGLEEEAAAACRAALDADPRHAGAWCALGAAQRRLALMTEARESFRRAVDLDPRYAQAWSNLGEWHLVREDARAALGYLDKALQCDGRLLEALNNRVAALYELGRYKDAEAAAKSAIEAYPDNAALHVNLGNVLLHSAKARLAVKSFQKALECDPNCAEAHLSLAMLLGETGRYGEVVAFLEQQLAVKGESAQRLAALALAQQVKGDSEKAEATCRKVLEKHPDNTSALMTLASCLGQRGEHLESMKLQQRVLVLDPNLQAACSNIAFDSTYVAQYTREEVFALHRDWARRFEPPTIAAAHTVSRQPDRPLRIGYVSGDLGTHPVGFLLRDVTRCHDRNNYYIHCYSMVREADHITASIRENADSWVDALLLTDDQLTEQIREDRIDILVDLSGHTAYNRLPVFVRRPAPIQATWIGYFHSSGLSSIDYFITDPHTTPAGSGQLFSEVPIWLPHSRFCYSPPEYAPQVAPPPSLGSQKITFGSFNRIEKIGNDVVEAWARILSAVPGSRLLLKAGNLKSRYLCDDLRARFAAQGIAADRLDLRASSPHPEMLEQYAEMDIALDTFPFNGGMTTLEALWMGVPVVTIAGNSVVSRQTVSALANVGLAEELAFADVDSFVAGAIALAGDPARLAKLRAELRPRMEASPLRQAERFTRDLEALFRRAWQAYCRGEKLPSDA